MPDIELQLQAYAEFLDAAAPSFDELKTEAQRRQASVYLPISLSVRRGLATAALAAVVVISTVGVVALIARGGTTVPATTLDPVPTTAPPPDTLRFMLAIETPVFASSEVEGAWDHRFVGPGGVTFVDGRFHMFRNGYGEERATGVGYGVSDDGLGWTSGAQAPVLTIEGAEYVEGQALVHSVIVTPEGSWVLYFDAVFEAAGDDAQRAIGVASAPGPLGPWTVGAQPVVAPSGTGWDATSAEQPTVIRDADGYVMYYAGTGLDGEHRIGRATSDDGMNWVRGPDPVLAPSAEWQRGAVRRPEVVQTSDGYVMLFANRSAGNWGVATSRDGLAWTEFHANPILTVTDVPGAQIRAMEVVLVDGTYYLYVETGGSRSSTDIVVLTRSNPIPIR